MFLGGWVGGFFRWVVESVGGWVFGWVDESEGGFLGGWVDGWIEGQTNLN